MLRVLAIITNGFEEIEAIAPVDLLRRAGVEVLLCSATTDIHVKGRTGIVIHADAPLGTQKPEAFDCLLLPGGPHVKELRADARIPEIIRQFAAAGKTVAAICAAPLLLKDAGILAQRKFTAHYSVVDELPQLLGAERVVVDGKIITSRGAGTSVDFGLEIIRQLISKDKALEIAKSISA